jgi:hypothetical protein
MKKILITLIGIAFINTAFAYGGILAYDKNRCTLEYTQLDLITGVEKTIKHTTQFDLRNHNDACLESANNLAFKINDWMRKDKNNVISNLTILYCKARTKNWFSSDWSSYKACSAENNEATVGYLNWFNRYYGRGANQQGYNVHKQRLREID